MGTMVGTVITVKELYGIKSADIQFRNGTNSTPLITLEEDQYFLSMHIKLVTEIWQK